MYSVGMRQGTVKFHMCEAVEHSTVTIIRER